MNEKLIMVVDDNIINLKLMRILLTKMGFTAHVAIDAKDALAVLEKVHPYLILMDIQLPGMDGLALTRQLKANSTTQDIVIVAFTAYAMRGDKQKAKDAGCDGYISKPIDLTTFASDLLHYMS